MMANNCYSNKKGQIFQFNLFLDYINNIKMGKYIKIELPQRISVLVQSLILLHEEH